MNEKPLVYVRPGEGDEFPLEVCTIRHGEPYVIAPISADRALSLAADLLNLRNIYAQRKDKSK